MINDETICMNQNANNENQNNTPAVIENEKEASWKKVTIGGVAGILMGAGIMYATDALAGETTEEPAEADPAQAAGSGASHDVTHHVADNGLKVADVSDDMSFGEAFAAAREEVGAGGVFEWKGNLYNTYVESEWNAMSASDKAEFAELVKPELPAAQQNTAAAAETNDTVAEKPADTQEAKETADEAPAEAQTVSDDADVNIVGAGKVDGHAAVVIDVNDDQQGDVAVIDVDDSGSLTSPDVVVDTQGNSATLGELAETAAPDTDYATQQYGMENPDIAPDASADMMMYDV